MSEEKKAELKNEDLAQVSGGFRQVTPAAQLYGSVEDRRPPCEQEPVGLSLEADPLTLGEAGLLPGDKPDPSNFPDERLTPLP